jgi:hypothetical protein
MSGREMPASRIAPGAADQPFEKGTGLAACRRTLKQPTRTRFQGRQFFKTRQ